MGQDLLDINERVAAALGLEPPATRREVATAVAKMGNLQTPTSDLAVAYLSAIAVVAGDFVEQSGRVTESYVGHITVVNADSALEGEPFEIVGQELGLEDPEWPWEMGNDLVEAAGKPVG